MRAWLLLLAASACNWTYGLAPTQLADARAPDAPARCESGSMQFSPQIRQAVLRACSDYTFSGGTAVAVCGGFTRARIAEGPVDGELVDVALAPTRAGAYLAAPRLTPDGDLIVGQRLTDATTHPSVYRRTETGWAWSHDLPFVLAPLEHVGAPSRGPGRHLFVQRLGSVEEAVEQADGTWATTTMAVDVFGVERISSPIHLSPDGLRAVFTSESIVRYAVRARIDEPFAGSFPIDSPDVQDAFLSEDCSRLYFSGLDSIFYMQR